jgi:hypothetical protein
VKYKRKQKNDEKIRASNVEGKYETLFCLFGNALKMFESNKIMIKMVNRMKSYA